jgi:IS30 family transposase
LGDWEADTVISRRSKAALQVLGERVSRLVLIRKIPGTTARSGKRSWRCQPGIRPTITYENSHEDVKYEQIDQSWRCSLFSAIRITVGEKGRSRTLISLIHRYLPKRTDLRAVSKDRIAAIEYRLNSRPRKCLIYRTPYEVSRQLSGVALAG